MKTPPFLFIGGHRKSGTSMFLSLFDNHPELCVFPTDITLFYAYFPVFTSGEYSREQLEARLKLVAFDELHETDNIKNNLDIEKFHRSFARLSKSINLAAIEELLPAYMQAFAQETGKSEFKRFVVKETSLEIYANELLDKFPNAVFVQLVRDPRDNYAAIRAGIERYKTFGDSERSLVWSVIHRGLLGMRLAIENQKKFGPDRYRVVRFEDLVRNPDEVLGGLSEWLRISFSPTMLVPTEMGVSTRGNSYDKIDFSSISDRNIGRWPERITRDEARVIEFYFSDVMAHFGYQASEPAENCLREVGEFYKWVNYKYFYFDRFGK